MKAEMNFDNIGGGSASIKENQSDFLGEITAANGTFYATKDCVMRGYIEKSTANTTVRLYVDVADNSHILASIGSSAPNYSIFIMGTGKTNHTSPYGVYIPKGTTVIAGADGNFDIGFYGLQ